MLTVHLMGPFLAGDRHVVHSMIASAANNLSSTRIKLTSILHIPEHPPHPLC